MGGLMAAAVMAATSTRGLKWRSPARCLSTTPRFDRRAARLQGREDWRNVLRPFFLFFFFLSFFCSEEPLMASTSGGVPGAG